MASCIVSFADTDGVRHRVEVEVESLYEAAVLAMNTFKKHNVPPLPAQKLDIEVRSSVVHTIKVQKVYDWLNGGAKSPRTAVVKDRLREILQR